MSLPFLQPYFGLSNSLQTAQASAGGGGVGGWVELGRTTLGSAASTITVSSLTNKRYYKFLFDQTAGQSGSADPFIRCNADTGSNYSDRVSDTGGADATTTSQTKGRIGGHPAGTTGNFGVGYISNYSTKEKLVICHEVGQSTAGAGTAPYRAEAVAKWANTADAINSISVSSGATWNTGTELVVLGWDPADTHTTNFWTELASVNGTGSSTNISSGTITAKKYLWIQMWNKTGAVSYSNMTFNNITTGIYAGRTSEGGGADGTTLSQTAFAIPPNANHGHFFNIFIINNSANEKLGIFSSLTASSTGAGLAPERSEGVLKWANTSAQITEIDMNSSSGNYTSDSILKVWGSN